MLLQFEILKELPVIIIVITLHKFGMKSKVLNILYSFKCSVQIETYIYNFQF